MLEYTIEMLHGLWQGIYFLLDLYWKLTQYVVLDMLKSYVLPVVNLTRTFIASPGETVSSAIDIVLNSKAYLLSFKDEVVHQLPPLPWPPTWNDLRAAFSEVLSRVTETLPFIATSTVVLAMVIFILIKRWEDSEAAFVKRSQASGSTQDGRASSKRGQSARPVDTIHSQGNEEGDPPVLTIGVRTPMTLPTDPLREEHMLSPSVPSVPSKPLTPLQNFAVAKVWSYSLTMSGTQLFLIYMCMTSTILSSFI
jgi:hypothetical protein